MSLNTPSFHVSDVATTVKRQFGDEAGVQITDSDIIRWINEGQTEISNVLKPIKAKSVGASVAGQKDYLFPTDKIVQVESIHYDGRKIPNVAFPVAEEYIIGTDPSLTTGIPTFWYEWAGVFSLWPIPDAVKSIELYYTKTPDTVTAVGDLLGVPDKHYESLVFYVMAKAYELDEEFEASAQQRQLFQNRILDQHDEERTAQNMTYPTITIID